MAKPFLTYKQQVEKLASKGLTIDDAASAMGALRANGYFSLVNGYKGVLRDSGSRKYRRGTTFADLVGLYHYDDQLRELFLRYLMVAERKLRSTLSYSFCCQNGESQAAYLDPSSYSQDKRSRLSLPKSF